MGAQHPQKLNCDYPHPQRHSKRIQIRSHPHLHWEAPQHSRKQHWNQWDVVTSVAGHSTPVQWEGCWRVALPRQWKSVKTCGRSYDSSGLMNRTRTTDICDLHKKYIL